MSPPRSPVTAYVKSATGQTDDCATWQRQMQLLLLRHRLWCVAKAMQGRDKHRAASGGQG